jgi:DNA-3-methyladenine glycosylase II
MDEMTLLEGIKWLTDVDPFLRKVVEQYGPPPLWEREPGFPSLLKIILEQQVSLASAQATYDKLITKLNVITPESFLILDDEELKNAGFSRQKTRYGRILAKSILDHSLDLTELGSLSDKEVENRLTSIIGIGKWTASIYLLMALGRPDIWPRGDLALNKALMKVRGLEKVPCNDVAEKIAECWRPYRSVAARILWHYYLNSRTHIQKYVSALI